MGGVQKWNAQLEKLEHPQKLKIKKFLEAGCIKQQHSDCYVCVPLKGYNKTTYTMTRTPAGNFKCNCQGFNKKGNCSHTAALYILIGNNQNQGTLF